MGVYKPQMCFAVFLMTLAGKQTNTQTKDKRNYLGLCQAAPHSPRTQVVRDVRAGASPDPHSPAAGKGTWGHPSPVQPRSLSAAATLVKGFTHLGVVSSSWADANI